MGRIEAGMSLKVNTKHHTHGIRIDVIGNPYTPRSINAKDTSDHEAIHAALGDVEDVTIIPGPGYAGRTRMRRGSVIAALGPHAMGANGTGWDVMVARMMGHSGSTGGIQEEVIRRHEEVVEISDELTRVGTMTGTEVDEAKRRAAHKRRFGSSATVSITAEDGVQRKIEGVEISGEGMVMIPGEWVFLPTKKGEPQAKQRRLALAA